MAAKKSSKRGKSSNSQANLTPWPKGKSGNPNGRPKGKVSLTSQLKEMASWAVPEELLTRYRTLFPNLPKHPSFVQVLALRTLIKGLDLKSGDVMVKEIWERIDGKVPFPLVGGGEDDDPLRFKFDFSSLSTKELDLFEGLLSKVQSQD